jgi:hypothetical protein
MSENDIHVSSPGSQLPSPVDKFKIHLSGDASDAISPNSTARGGNGRRSVPGEDSIPADNRKKSYIMEAESEKCHMCNKNVFKVERIVCAGLKWHQSCFGEIPIK